MSKDVLFKCPKCGKDVSTKTINCSNCGFSIKEHLKRQYNFVKVVCILGAISLIIFAIIKFVELKTIPPTVLQINSFMSAVKSNDISKAKELLKKNSNLINVNDGTALKMTPLLGAARYGNKEMVDFLLSEGADINAKNNCNETFLHQAAIGGSKEIAEIGLNKGLDVNAKNNNDEDTPLLLGLLLNDNITYDLVQLLISRGADVNAKDKEGVTPLHHARNKEIAELLISKGASVNAKDKEGNTALHYTNSKEIAELLISRGADVNSKNEYGSTPLHYARIGIKRKEIAELLISKGAIINSTDFTKFTPSYNKKITEAEFLIYCIMVNEEPLITELLKKNKKIVNDKTKDGTPLNCALMWGSPKEVIELLISKGADVNCSDNLGTPLIIAVNFYENYTTSAEEIIKLLISKGADVNAKDNFGKTPLDYAKEHNKFEIIDILIKNEKLEGNISGDNFSHRIKSSAEDTLAGISLKETSSQVIKILGNPDVTRGGRNDFDVNLLNYRYKNGISVTFCDYEVKNTWTVFSIYIQEPCTIGTSKGIKIGSSENEVRKNYLIKTSSKLHDRKLDKIINDSTETWANKTVYCGDDYYGELIAFKFDERGNVNGIAIGVLND